MTIAEIADTIIPATGTPGAKAEGVGPFIVMMIHDCYPKDIQKIFIEGINEVEKSAESKFNKSFIAMHPAERERLLKEFAYETDEQKKILSISQGTYILRIFYIRNRFNPSIRLHTNTW